MGSIAILPRRLSEGDLLLRPLSIRDGPRLCELMAEPSAPPASWWSWVPLWFRTRHTFTPAYVVLRGGRGIGFVGLYDLELRRSCKIAMALDQRRRGYGSRVFRLLSQRLSEHALVRLILAEVEPSNRGSVSFLKSLGFEDVGTSGVRRLLGYELERCRPPDPIFVLRHRRRSR